MKKMKREQNVNMSENRGVIPRTKKLKVLDLPEAHWDNCIINTLAHWMNG